MRQARDVGRRAVATSTDGRGSHVSRNVVAIAAALIALSVYVPRVCRTLSVMGDSAVFVSAAVSFGVPQPSGYPLYTALAHAATFMPFGALPFRVHLLSAVYHAVTVGLVAAVLHELTCSSAAAFGGALMLAFSRAFQLGSLYAEVFPLNDLFTALALLFAFRFQRASEHGDEIGANRALSLLSVTAGFASAHHQLITLLVPAMLVLVLGKNRRLLFKPRRLLVCVALFATPFVTCYALVPIAARRAPVPNWGDVAGLGDVLRLLTRADFGGPMSPFLGERGGGPVEQLTVYASSVARSLGAVGLIAVTLGAGFLFSRPSVRTTRATPPSNERNTALALTLAALFSGPIFAVLNVLPVATDQGAAFAERFTTMSLVVLAVFAGAGLFALEQWLGAVLSPRAGALVTAAAFVPTLAANVTEIDLSRDQRGQELADDLLSGTENSSLVLVSGDALYGATTYRCGVERQCGARIVFSPGQLHMPWRVRQLRRQHPELRLPEPTGKFLTVREVITGNLDARPVYIVPTLLDREPPLREAFSYLPEGLLLRVLPAYMNTFATERTRFLVSARRLVTFDGCSGCTMRSSELIRPSLEHVVIQTYVDAFVNHARILRVYFPDVANLAAELEARAKDMDSQKAAQYL